MLKVSPKILSDFIHLLFPEKELCISCRWFFSISLTTWSNNITRARV